MLPNNNHRKIWSLALSLPKVLDSYRNTVIINWEPFVHFREFFFTFTATSRLFQECFFLFTATLRLFYIIWFVEIIFIDSYLKITFQAKKVEVSFKFLAITNNFISNFLTKTLILVIEQ